MTVADIATLYLRMGQSLDLIAGKYHLPLASVYAAMAYYYEAEGVSLVPRLRLGMIFEGSAFCKELLRRQQPSH